MRVIRDSKSQDSSVNGIREPGAQQEVRHLASSLGNIAESTASSRRRGIANVPTDAIGRAKERRAYVRVRLALSLRLQRVAGQRGEGTPILRTEDISSSGVYFLSPHAIEPGTPIELELLVVDRPLGSGSVRMRADAHVVRAIGAQKPGWHGVAAAFDDIRFFRDEQLPSQLHAG